MTSPAMQPPIPPANGQEYQPVVTLNGWTLPWRMNGEWKEFHLVAEEVEREIAPGMIAKLWGYNGQTPGPTIEAVEGDKVRIFVTNRLPEHTTVHWHGMLLPNGMDGVGGLTQPHIKVGQTFVYEFVLTKQRHVHVPPAFRRDGADGHGHDGLVRGASQGPELPARRPRLRLRHELLSLRARHLPTPSRRDDRLQYLDVQCPRVSGDRRPAGAGSATGCASGSPISP